MANADLVIKFEGGLDGAECSNLQQSMNTTFSLNKNNNL